MPMDANGLNRFSLGGALQVLALAEPLIVRRTLAGGSVVRGVARNGRGTHVAGNENGYNQDEHCGDVQLYFLASADRFAGTTY